jgi:hypothetical protein
VENFKGICEDAEGFWVLVKTLEFLGKFRKKLCCVRISFGFMKELGFIGKSAILE